MKSLKPEGKHNLENISYFFPLFVPMQSIPSGLVAGSKTETIGITAHMCTDVKRR